IAEFRKALDLRSGIDAEAHRSLGRALYESGALAEAKSEFETAIAQREQGRQMPIDAAPVDAAPEDGESRGPARRSFPEAHHDLGRVLYDLGQSEQAIAQFRASIDQRGGEFPRAHFDLGRALTRAGHYLEAMTELNKAIEQQGGVYPEAYFQTGLLLARQGDSEAAIDAYKAAIEQSNGVFPEAYYHMGLAHVRSRNPEAAVKAYRTAIEQRGGHYPEAHNDLGRVLYSMDDIEAANEEYSIAVRQRSGASDDREPKAKLDAARGRRRDARRSEVVAEELEAGLRQAPAAADAGKPAAPSTSIDVDMEPDPGFEPVVADREQAAQPD
ncbi:MAG TPA: tetratricopeptide repeat protein, partial [Blastocatellia bacterium]|nr:tetratricopeptide repeat protein [Blastocatellia bacterium]